MLSLRKNISFNYLLTLTLASAVISLNGCGGGGDSTKSAPDTSGVTDAKLKKSLKDGLTKGLSSNMDSLGSSLSTVNNNLNSSSSPKLLAGVAASDPIVDGLNDAKDKIVEKFNLLIDNSVSSSNGNVYTFDPNENTICSDPSLGNTPAEIADCKTILQPITFVSTVNAVDSNNNITEADTDFKYNNDIFSKLGFTNSSSYYQVEFGGLPGLLAGINGVASPSDQIDIPNSMAGSLRIGSNAQSATSGTFKVSVPTTIAISDTSPVTNISIGQTNNLFSVSADSATNAISVNVSLSALDILTTQTDDQGTSFTEQVILSSITGNATATNNGNTVTLTGVGASSIQFKIDGALALDASLASLGATISSANNQTLLTLANALDFNLAMTNVKGFIDDSQPATDTLSMNIDAVNGTAVRKSTTNNGPKLLRVTNGSLMVNKTATGSTAVNSTVPTNSCLNTDDLSLDNSANCQ
jgi:hypothetical protein